MSVINLQFSFSEFISKVREIPNPHDSRGRDYEEATLTKSLAHALEIMDKGHTPKGGFEAFDVPPTDFETQSATWDVVGAVPDIGVYLSGMPMNMIDITPSIEQKRFVKIAVQVNCNGYVDASDMQLFNDKVYHAISSLKAQGIEVEMSALLFNDVSSSRTECLLVDILKQGEVFNPSMLSAAMHVSFFRRIWFAWAYHHYDTCGGSDRPPSIVGDGYHVVPSTEFQGRSFDLKQFILDCVSKDEELRLELA
jgi:hypothetical protein